MKNAHRGELLLDAEFSDFDYFSETVRSWSLDFYQVEAGPFSAILRQIVLPNFQLGEVRFSRALEQHGAPPAGMRTFGVQYPGAPPYKWRGHEIGNNELLFFPRGSELYSLTKAGFHVYTFSVDEEFLLRQARLSGSEQFEEFLESGREVYTLRTERMIKLNEVCRLFIAAAGEPGGVRAAAQQELMAQIIANVVEGVLEATELSSPRETARQRSRAIRKARELVQDCREHPLTVEKICEETGVKARTLRYAFQEEFGLSPKQWLKFRTLNRIRRELKNSASSSASITEIANRWGIWHMGQFARDYRQFFGERPSETVRKDHSQLNR